MRCCNAYESNSMTEVMGETLRPGGFSLTDKGVEFCMLSSKDSVLDLGCGRGATVNYLFEKYNIKATGVDPSVKLISVAREKYAYADFLQGSGEELPFEDNSFDCVFAECTLSLMDDLDRTIRQVSRVLKDGGAFVITDVYAKNPESVYMLKEFKFNSCMRGLHDLNELGEMLKRTDFTIERFEDCSFLLKEMLVKIGFSYGSMSAFWNASTQNCIDGCNFQEVLKLCKPGYFMIVAKKGGSNHG